MRDVNLNVIYRERGLLEVLMVVWRGVQLSGVGCFFDVHHGGPGAPSLA